MIRIFLLIGTGGFIGSVARYFLQLYFLKIIPASYPFGTMVVNILGCFVIGIVYAISGKGNYITPEWRLFLATGLCGGFTTFSAFTYESITLINEGQFLKVSIYVAASVIVGIFATYLGMVLFK